MTRVLPPFPAAPLGSLSGFDLQKCIDNWPKFAKFVSESPEQCLAAVRASFDDSDRCVAYVARTIAHKNQATPDYFWSSEQEGRAEVANSSRFLISIEDAITHLDDTQPLPPNLPLDMAILGQACGHLLTVMGTLSDLSFVFEVGNLFEDKGLSTFNALIYRLHAALDATQNALHEAKLVASHVAYAVGNIWRPNVFAAILDAGNEIDRQCNHVAVTYAHLASIEGGPIHFDAQDREAVFRKLVATVLANTTFSRTQVGSYMVAAIHSEVAERRRLGQLDNLTPPVIGEGAPSWSGKTRTAMASGSSAGTESTKPILKPRQQLALAIIRDNPGLKAIVIAKRLGIEESTFLSHYVPKLKLHGVKNERDGYFCDLDSK